MEKEVEGRRRKILWYIEEKEKDKRRDDKRCQQTTIIT